MALILTIALLIVTVLLRATIQYIRTGDSGIRRLKKNSSFELKLATFSLYGVLLGILVVSTYQSLGMIKPQFSITPFDYEIGVFICCFSLVLTFVAQLQMGDWWRIGVDEEEQTELVNQGIYAYIRNPIYSAVLLFAVGLVFMVMHWCAILMLILGYAGIEFLVKKVEEPYLTKLHGQSYIDYKKNTWSYLPYF